MKNAYLSGTVYLKANIKKSINNAKKIYLKPRDGDDFLSA